MNTVLIIGSGAREHALGWKLAQSQEVSKIYFAPGNAGTARENKGENIAVDATREKNYFSLLAWLQNHPVDLVVIGPEGPISWGLADRLRDAQIDVFAPSQRASLLEADKFFSFQLMQKLNIPQAKGRLCYNLEEAKVAIRELASSRGVVLKARGLTGGKGVFVARSSQEALAHLERHWQKYGPHLLISERLEGEEFSIFALSDGRKAVTFDIAFQDHKPLLDGNRGPNTGGMGAYAPFEKIDPQTIESIKNNIIQPLLDDFAAKKMPYIGFLYLGMILTEEGYKVLEFNVRFGDPECQPAMMMLDDALFPILKDASRGKLKDLPIKLKKGAACCVVLAAKGYPDRPEKNKKIRGLDDIEESPILKVFHASTWEKAGEYYNGGGRVLSLTAYGEDLEKARREAYHLIGKIEMEGGFHYRLDIAKKMEER